MSKADFEFEPVLFCRAYDRAIQWALSSGSDPDGSYYWSKFRAEIYEMYYRFARSRANRAGQIYPFSRVDVRTKLAPYVRKDSKTPAPLRVARVRRFGLLNDYGHEVHDIVRRRIDYHRAVDGVPDELRDFMAVLMIAEPGTDMPGIGYRAAENTFYLER